MSVEAITKYRAGDGSEWDTADDAEKRDRLNSEVASIEAMLGAGINSPDRRRQHNASVLSGAKQMTVLLCRREFPDQSVFQHEPSEIHPMSFAGRFLDDNGGPLRRVWWRFQCIDEEGREYEQPYYAINPHRWTGETI